MIVAYTDGSATIHGEKLGGFGVYMIDDKGYEFFYHQGYIGTKTGRMELRAIITALKVADKSQKLTIYSDSMYCINCVNKKWLWKWRDRFWEGIKNVDLVKEFFEEYQKFYFPPKLIHIKGHTNKDDIHSLGNSIADCLANYKDQKTYLKDIYYEEIVL